MQTTTKIKLLAGLMIFSYGYHINNNPPHPATATPAEQAVDNYPVSSCHSQDYENHLVQTNNQTFDSIASKYGITGEELKSFNQHYKQLAQHIKPGDQLCIPGHAAKPKTKPIEPEDTNPTNPGKLTTVFIEAAKNCPNLEWKYLAGIAKIETNYGTHGGAKIGLGNVVSPTITSWAGAKGPMQHMPKSWADYGNGGNINDFDDAAAASARHLCADSIIDGTPQGTYKALRRYYTGKTSYTKEGNWYADKVFSYADKHDTNI